MTTDKKAGGDSHRNNDVFFDVVYEMSDVSRYKFAKQSCHVKFCHWELLAVHIFRSTLTCFGNFKWSTIREMISAWTDVSINLKTDSAKNKIRQCANKLESDSEWL